MVNNSRKGKRNNGIYFRSRKMVRKTEEKEENYYEQICDDDYRDVTVDDWHHDVEDLALLKNARRHSDNLAKINKGIKETSQWLLENNINSDSDDEVEKSYQYGLDQTLTSGDEEVEEDLSLLGTFRKSYNLRSRSSLSKSSEVILPLGPDDRTDDDSDVNVHRMLNFIGTRTNIRLPISSPNISTFMAAEEFPIIQTFIDIANYKFSDIDFPSDYYAPLDPNACTEQFSTKQEFCEGLKSICAFFNIEVAGMNALLKFLKEMLPQINLPVKVMRTTGNSVYELCKYIKEDKRRIVIDVCINECIIYAGEYETDIICPVCSTYRFRPCKAKNCPDGSDCHPWINRSHTVRTSNQVLFYRPIIPRLLEAYTRNVSAKLNLFDYNRTRFKKPGYMTDILDGSVPVSEMEKMHVIFLEKKALFEEQFPDKPRLVELSLLLSLSYDGDQLFKRESVSLWPLLCSILNFDPSYRTRLGLGMFLIAIHSLKVGSPAEKAMKDDLLAQELKALKAGIVFEVLNEDGELISLFLQARVVFFHCDTVGFEKHLCVEGSGSISGCPYCKTCGLSRDIISRRIFVGSTVYLPQDHIFRFLGAVEWEAGYFGELGRECNQVNGHSISYHATRWNIHGMKVKKFKGNKTNIGDESEYDVEVARDAVEASRLNGLILTNNLNPLEVPSGKSYISAEFPYADFAEALWFPSDDHRPEETVERTTTESYIANGAEASRQKAEYLADCDRRNSQPAVDRTFSYNGVHPEIPKLFCLGTPRFEWLTSDIMHAVSNAQKYFMYFLKGDRGLKRNERQLAVSQYLYPFLQSALINPPWLVSAADQRLADSVHYTLNIPVGYKTDYSYDLPFHYIGPMKSHQRLVFMMTFMTYFLSFTSIARPYKRFFERYSWDLCQIMNPVLETAYLPYLISHVTETKALQEGLLPDTEQNYIYHEFIHIVRSLLEFGNAKSMACFAAERAMKVLGDGVLAGGQHFILPVTDRFVAKENAVDFSMRAYFKSLDVNIDSLGRYSSQALKLTNKFKPVTINDDMKTIMFNNLYEFLGSQDIKYKVIKSRFYRIYDTFEVIHRDFLTGPVEQRICLSSWLRQVVLRIQDGVHSLSLRDLGVYYISDEIDPTSQFTGEESPEAMEEWAEYIDVHIVNKRILYSSDLITIIADMGKFATRDRPIAAFTHATIKGVSLLGRGSEFAEDSLVAEDYSRTNRVGLRLDFELQNWRNNLKNQWHFTHQYSCWCEVRDRFINTRRVVAEQVYFAHMNYYFRFYIPSDSIVHGLAFANAVLRIPHDELASDTYRGHHYILPNNSSYHPDKHFVSLNYVLGSALAVSALDNENLPLLNPLCAEKYLQNKIIKYPLILSERESVDVSKLYFIELHKERLRIEYAGIESDLDDTMVFESVILQYYSH